MTSKKSSFARQKNDLYRTEAYGTLAFCRHVDLTGKRVWEPSAGLHDMADVLRTKSAHVLTSDITTYGREHDGIFDFLSDGSPPFPCGVDAIVTNPPYGVQNRLAVRYVEKALSRCDGIVAMLLTAKFDSGGSRVHLFRDNPRFQAKIVLVDRIKWFGGKGTGQEDHAWFIWGPPSPFPPPPVLRYEGRRPK